MAAPLIRAAGVSSAASPNGDGARADDGLPDMSQQLIDAARAESEQAASGAVGLDPTETLALLLRHLKSGSGGLSSREAERRLVQYGTNEIERRGGRRWPRELARQFTHPLALLLAAAAGLAWIAGIVPVALAIAVVILINAAFAFIQEVQAERAVEALAQFLPSQAKVIRDGRHQVIEARRLVPGDLLIIEEGDRISADARLLSDGIEVDASTLTGESMPVFRAADLLDSSVPLLQARNLVFSGTTCTEGEARALVFATGMHTELGRIAALSERVSAEESPLEAQVRRVAWLIALIAVISGLAFIPIATLGAGLSLSAAVVFAVGLLVGNVPEGLLPVITLALAVGVRELVGRGAVVKRLSAVETLGSTTVICTDKTGTLTANRMEVKAIWTAWGTLDPDRAAAGVGDAHDTDDAAGVPDGAAGVPDGAAGVPDGAAGAAASAATRLATAMAACNNAELDTPAGPSGDPTEVALLEAARSLGIERDSEQRDALRRRHFHFDPVLKRMSTVDERDGRLWVHAKGAPEQLLDSCTRILGRDGEERRLGSDERRRVSDAVQAYAARGLRVLGLADRLLDPGAEPPARREQAERDLCFLGMVAMLDPPRPEVAAAVSSCHEAGIRVIVITGDHPVTAAAIAREVGIGDSEMPVVTGERLERMSDAQLDRTLRTGKETVFARTSPEAKLRIAEALRLEGQVVAMTGDGVNDAPALRRADIGVAMGRAGSDVAREASTMVLTDDNFATIVAAVEAGRRVYDNIRKFVLYIFAHATPEVTPFLFFALSGGRIPLPLTVLQLLAFDVGTETLPALALGREPAEPGLMQRAPRPRSEGVIRPPMLLRAWLFLGLICAALQMAGFFFVLLRAGWHPGDAVGRGHSLHHAYLTATTMTFFGMIAGQIGTAFAARTERASLRSVGVFSNRLLLWGIAFELILAGVLIYAPPFQSLLATAALSPADLLFALPFPFIVWGADELRRYLLRRRMHGR
jgi:magnesium-transporting ATPase (P-type)